MNGNLLALGTIGALALGASLSQHGSANAGHPFLPLATIQAHLPAMVAQGVSTIARSPRGFLTAYTHVGGRHMALSAEWHRKREAFIARHMAQVKNRSEPLFRADGEPTRRHLALIAWAYSLAPDLLQQGSRAIIKGDALAEPAVHALIRDDLQIGDYHREYAFVRHTAGIFQIKLEGWGAVCVNGKGRKTVEREAAKMARQWGKQWFATGWFPVDDEEVWAMTWAAQGPLEAFPDYVDEDEVIDLVEGSRSTLASRATSRAIRHASRAKKATTTQLRFRSGGDFFYRGQYDGYILAINPEKKIVGRLDWSSYQGKTAIKMVEVPEEHRRAGIATALYKELFRSQGIKEADLEPGWRTPEGQAFRKGARLHST